MKNYVIMVYEMVKDIERIVAEAENDTTIIEYMASLDEEVAEEINEFDDLTMAAIKLAIGYGEVSRESVIYYNVYAIRRNIEKLAELISGDLNIQEYVIEHCVNYSEVIWDAFDNGDFKEAVGYILIEEIINA